VQVLNPSDLRAVHRRFIWRENAHLVTHPTRFPHTPCPCFKPFRFARCASAIYLVAHLRSPSPFVSSSSGPIGLPRFYIFTCAIARRSVPAFTNSRDFGIYFCVVKCIHYISSGLLVQFWSSKEKNTCMLFQI
jgi:hypothetical protein